MHAEHRDHAKAETSCRYPHAGQPAYSRRCSLHGNLVGRRVKHESKTSRVDKSLWAILACAVSCQNRVGVGSNVRTCKKWKQNTKHISCNINTTTHRRALSCWRIHIHWNVQSKISMGHCSRLAMAPGSNEVLAVAGQDEASASTTAAGGAQLRRCVCAPMRFDGLGRLGPARPGRSAAEGIINNHHYYCHYSYDFGSMRCHFDSKLL